MKRKLYTYILFTCFSTVLFVACDHNKNPSNNFPSQDLDNAKKESVTSLKTEKNEEDPISQAENKTPPSVSTPTPIPAPIPTTDPDSEDKSPAPTPSTPEAPAIPPPTSNTSPQTSLNESQFIQSLSPQSFILYEKLPSSVQQSAIRSFYEQRNNLPTNISTSDDIVRVFYKKMIEDAASSNPS